MAGTNDPVYLLREYTISNKPIAASKTHILFDNISYPRQTLTGVHSSQNASQYFTLEALWFVAHTANSAQSFSDYFKAANQAGVPKVSFNDRPLLLAWLKGESETLSLLDAAPSASAPPLQVLERETRALPTAPTSLLRAPVLSDAQRAVQHARATRLEQRALSLLTNQSGQEEKPPAQSSETAGESSNKDMDTAELLRLRQKFAARAPLTLHDDEDMLAVGTGDDGEEAALLSTSRAILQEVRARETNSHGTLRALQSPNFTFDKMLETVKEMRQKELIERQKLQQQAFEALRQTSAQQYDRYNVDKSRAWGGMSKDIDEFGLDTNASMLARAPILSAQPKSTSMSEATNVPRKSSESNSGSLKRARDDEESAHASKKARRRSGNGSSSGQDSQQQPPIIIVPERFILTTRNVKEWLLEERFTADETLGRPPAQVELTRINGRPGLPNRFLVINDARKLSEQDWQRVVAVFVQGQAWQFKGWKYPTPAELFGHVRGYYLHYDDQKVPPEIKDWNVRPLSVSRVNAHSGAKAAAMFWADVDDLLSLKRNVAK